MKIVTLKDIGLVSSTIPEDQYKGVPTANGKWVAGPYAIDAVVYHTGAIHMVYKSLIASNTTTPGDDITKWNELGATDRWAMFDAYINTQSTVETVAVDASGCDYIGVFNCYATSVTFTLTLDGVVIKTEIINMDVSEIADYDEWIFWPVDYRKRMVWEFPQYEGAVLTVTFLYTTSAAKCGFMGVGKAYMIGMTDKAIDAEINDYSYMDENKTTGVIKMIPGNNSDAGTKKIILQNRMVDIAKARIIENLGKVAIYDFNNSRFVLESLIYCGFSAKTKTKISRYNDSIMTFSMRGIV